MSAKKKNQLRSPLLDVARLAKFTAANELALLKKVAMAMDREEENRVRLARRKRRKAKAQNS